MEGESTRVNKSKAHASDTQKGSMTTRVSHQVYGLCLLALSLCMACGQDVASSSSSEHQDMMIGDFVSDSNRMDAGVTRDQNHDDKDATSTFDMSHDLRVYHPQDSSNVNKYYALRLDATTQKVKKPRVLMLQLEQARIQAREAAGLALERLGFVPSSSRFYYQLASSLAVQSDDNDRLYALSLYWLSSFWSELAMALAE